METIQEEKKASKYAKQIEYDKQRRLTDPEYKKKKNQITVNCIRKRLENDPEYRAKHNEYQRLYQAKIRENHRAFRELQKTKDKVE